MAWQLTQCRWTATARLDDLLADDWEPFAVTDDREASTTVWLRRETARAEAEAIVPRPPSVRGEPA